MIVTFSLHPADEESKQVTAIKVLMESLEKGTSTLCYLYEEYSVIWLSLCHSLPASISIFSVHGKY